MASELRYLRGPRALALNRSGSALPGWLPRSLDLLLNAAWDTLPPKEVSNEIAPVPGKSPVLKIGAGGDRNLRNSKGHSAGLPDLPLTARHRFKGRDRWIPCKVA